MSIAFWRSYNLPHLTKKSSCFQKKYRPRSIRVSVFSPSDDDSEPPSVLVEFPTTVTADPSVIPFDHIEGPTEWAIHLHEFLLYSLNFANKPIKAMVMAHPVTNPPINGAVVGFVTSGVCIMVNPVFIVFISSPFPL